MTGARTVRHAPGYGTGPVSGRDSGRVSVLVAIALTGILAVIGLAFDGSAHFRMMQRAENMAAEAARTGGQQIDRARAVNGEAKVIDVEAALAAAEAYVDSVPLPDNVTVTRRAERVPDPGGGYDGTRLKVTVTLTYQPVMLSLFRSGAMTATGEATAGLLTENPET
ncbi:pilus assembly protein TadG-related protein [Micromonospora echinofusca]|uniref:pilus assembly protein TadG-related protein n=1 Tax=Micromonospora echinofusca TaxID=47858 RepID=UPI0027DC2083|nr:pilus assembly protein TadG-related protein [Micromonospora echinofusca]